MSWGDQIMDELGFWDRERNPTMSKELMMLYGFSFWLLKKGKINLTEKEMELLVEEFLREVGYRETKEIDKLAFIFIRDRKLLTTFSKGVDVFYIPGGKREGTETDQEALMREIKEELSVDILPETVKYYGTFRAQAHGKPEGTFVKMTCYTGSFSGELSPSNEIEKIIWVTFSDRDGGSPVDKVILDDLKSKGLID